MRQVREFSIIQKGLKKNYFHDLYYKMLKVSWSKFFLISALFYILLNFLFALIYYFSPAEILNARPDSLWDAFNFSFQTSSTLGYGHLIPNSNFANSLVVLDTLMGIFYVAIITGMAFSKFARPMANVLFSNNILYTSFDHIPTLMFRLGNGRDTHIIDASLNVAVILPYTSKEGHEMKRFYNLPLLSNNNPTFSLSWTAMHQIDKNSPLFGIDFNSYEEKGIIVFVSFTGVDDILSQTVNSSHRYSCRKIIKAKKFTDVLKLNETKSEYTIDFTKFNEYEL